MFVGRRSDGSVYGAWMCKQADDEFHTGIEAIGLLFRDYCNDLKNGTYTGSGANGTKTLAEVKADFAQKWNSL